MDSETVSGPTVWTSRAFALSFSFSFVNSFRTFASLEFLLINLEYGEFEILFTGYKNVGFGFQFNFIIQDSVLLF